MRIHISIFFIQVLKSQQENLPMGRKVSYRQLGYTEVVVKVDGFRQAQFPSISLGYNEQLPSHGGY